MEFRSPKQFEEEADRQIKTLGELRKIKTKISINVSKDIFRMLGLEGSSLALFSYRDENDVLYNFPIVPLNDEHSVEVVVND